MFGNVILSAILLLITLFIFIGIKSKAGEALTKFPLRMECNQLDSLFPNSKFEIKQ